MFRIYAVIDGTRQAIGETTTKARAQSIVDALWLTDVTFERVADDDNQAPPALRRLLQL